MAFAGRVEKLDGKLPHITYRWDPETEILSGQFKGAGKGVGLTGSVELEGAEGSFVVLDVASGVVRGLEVVVWPETAIVQDLTPPAPTSKGQLLMPARQSQPGVAAVEVDTHLSAEKRPDESIIHLRAGPKRRVEVVQLADDLIVEVDGEGNIAGLWLSNVPPFPQAPDAM
ncbi:MAG: hypothetical protein HY560_01550 [Gemmatimonadetes bacterium]|nr:hypothetical protein [Gemmatimonadota bacterium]